MLFGLVPLLLSVACLSMTKANFNGKKFKGKRKSLQSMMHSQLKSTITYPTCLQLTIQFLSIFALDGS